MKPDFSDIETCRKHLFPTAQEALENFDAEKVVEVMRENNHKWHFSNSCVDLDNFRVPNADEVKEMAESLLDDIEERGDLWECGGIAAHLNPMGMYSVWYDEII